MIVLATLAHHQHDDDTARRLLMSAGPGRLPASLGGAYHLAAQLGITQDYAADLATLYQPDSPHGGMGATRSLSALRAELARRGWD